MAVLSFVKPETGCVAPLDVHGDDAVEVGQGTLIVAGGQVAGRVKYIVVWKRVNGEWKYYRDIWNDLPA